MTEKGAAIGSADRPLDREPCVLRSALPAAMGDEEDEAVRDEEAGLSLLGTGVLLAAVVEDDGGEGAGAGGAPEEAGEVLTQLAFYAGWPSVFTALPVVKQVIDTRLE